jgi:undecaprenyl-diphosphatase
MDESLLEVVILGVVQGLTEFLPVSSDGHLAVTQMWLGITEGNLLLSVMLHIGTLAATVFYFRARLRLIVLDLLAHWRQPLHALAQPAGIDAKIVVLASIPTAIIGLTLEPLVERWTVSPAVVAAGFVATGLVLLSTLFVPQRQLHAPSNWGALLVGIAQGAAVLPGVSRSGCTIAALLALGLQPARAFELSMLVGIPAVFGAILLQGIKHLAEMRGATELLLGALVTFSTGLVALRLLRGFVTNGRLFWFAIWVFTLAALVWLLSPNADVVAGLPGALADSVARH